MVDHTTDADATRRDEIRLRATKLAARSVARAVRGLITAQEVAREAGLDTLAEDVGALAALIHADAMTICLPYETLPPLR
jgi:hypothetical protein